MSLLYYVVYLYCIVIVFFWNLLFKDQYYNCVHCKENPNPTMGNSNSDACLGKIVTHQHFLLKPKLQFSFCQKKETEITALVIDFG